MSCDCSPFGTSHDLQVEHKRYLLVLCDKSRSSDQHFGQKVAPDQVFGTDCSAEPATILEARSSLRKISAMGSGGSTVVSALNFEVKGEKRLRFSV